MRNSQTTLNCEPIVRIAFGVVADGDLKPDLDAAAKSNTDRKLVLQFF